MSGVTRSERPFAGITPAGLRRYLQEHPIVVLSLLLFVLIGVLEAVRPGAVTPNWMRSTVLFAAPLGILAAGQTLVMLTGGIDLSVANVATASAYIMASNARHGDMQAVLLGLAVGVAVGLVNGLGIAVFQAQPLIMTLGTALAVTGGLTVYSQFAVTSVPSVPGFIHALGTSTLLGFIPLSLLLWAPIALIILVGLRRTGFGRLLYAIGDNAAACRLAGVRVWQVRLVNYAICGLLSAVAGLVLAGTINTADLGLATDFLLPCVAAVVIGGTSIFGGSGDYSGTIIGALILTVLNSVLTLLSAPEPIKQILYGAIILLLASAYTRVLSDT
ncbi:MAG TPA: ABC transporter permease [Candidatus Dormibacteraeota bacterium]|nr:ABC transporter permease [Candidatus Dormibacteraeota bacterium]